jgi:diguanylate cyclase (GGDEF)-like protein
MNDSRRAKVLCIDDEPQTLASVRAILEPRYEWLTAGSGSEGLKLLGKHHDVVAIIAGMRMPDMDGPAFLARAGALLPNAGRILMTSGQTNAQSAIAAVNEAGILKFLSKPCRPQELLAAVEAAVKYHRRASLENTSLRRALTEEITRQDLSTGLASRARFIETLESICADADGKNLTRAFAVLIIYVENLQDINVAHGHSTGDLAMQGLARRLREHAAQARCIARWGDEEFAVLLANSFALESGLLAAAEALVEELTIPMALPKTELRARVCIGIALVPLHTGDAKTAVKFAGIAARQAHQQGAAACLFRSDWAQRLEYRQQLLAALRDAIEGNQLHMHYQPIIDLKDGTVRTLEALVRWNHPTLGPVSSAQFVNLAEESGEMPRLGQWILRHACREARQLVGRYCARVAVNISVQQLLHDGFLTQLDEALRQAQLQPQELELELTESVLASDAEHSLAVLIELRRRGIAVAIDDFGTGYSSLAYLQRFPADLIKVDRSFVTSLGQGGETIISAALSIGRAFGMEVVIEGVETELERRQLWALGATLFQGFLYGRPMPAASVEQWFLGSAFAAASSAVLAPQSQSAQSESENDTVEVQIADPLDLAATKNSS